MGVLEAKCGLCAAWAGLEARHMIVDVAAPTAKSRFGNTEAAFRKSQTAKSREDVSVLGRPGSDLLFQVLRLSTIGAGEFNGRVRDGIGFLLPARTTRPAKDGMKQAGTFVRPTMGIE